ncbi:DoxX family protein [Halorussus amylolyticus]|uniref:DoxX family protein n=1 Tax=Halorussus amylolyticus TaxID=1126242 RepID=UPI00104ACF98|nr:DoxX family membrane protein [Halorussus amylolyticus]
MASKLVERTPEAESESPEPRTDSTAFRLARLLFGGATTLMAVDNFLSMEGTVEYAEGTAPAPERTVPAISGALLFGGVGIALWKAPRLAAGAVATFLVSVTPTMHDFWTVEDDQQREQQLIHFLKNAAMLGGALAFLGVAEDER